MIAPMPAVTRRTSSTPSQCLSPGSSAVVVAIAVTIWPKALYSCPITIVIENWAVPAMSDNRLIHFMSLYRIFPVARRRRPAIRSAFERMVARD